jgi:hypothetical protein
MQLSHMPDSDMVAQRLRQMLLDMGDDQIMVEAERALLDLCERDRRISETMEELMQEVDDLLLRMDKLDLEALESDEVDICDQGRARGPFA